MTQIVVTLEKGANSSLLRRMIENMRGVLNVSVQHKTDRMAPNASEDWIKKLQDLKQSIDVTVIDMDDDRTRYIMSK